MSVDLETRWISPYDEDEDEDEDMPNFEHAIIGANLITRLNSYVTAQKLGRVADSSVEYRFLMDKKPRGGRKPFRQPDVSFVKQERVPQRFDDYPTIAPDLVVEIVSPSDRLVNILAKIALYQKYGVKLIWLVQPFIQSVSVYRLATRTLQQQIELNGELDGEDVIPGFKLALTDIFNYPKTGIDELVEETTDSK